MGKKVCDVCGGTEFGLEKKRSVVRYGEKTVQVDDLKVETCAGCGFTAYTPVSSRKLRVAYANIRCLSENLITPDEIKGFRKSIGLSQEQLSALLEMSKKTVARYETGTAVPSRLASRFLKILVKNRKVALDEAVEMGFIKDVFGYENVACIDKYKSKIKAGEQTNLKLEETYGDEDSGLLAGLG